MSWNDDVGTVRNFRKVAGLLPYSNIYRCGSPDGLGDMLLEGIHDNIAGDECTNNSEDLTLTNSERTLLYDATLVIDLRMSIERDNDGNELFRQLAPGGPFRVVDNGACKLPTKEGLPQRTVLQIDLVGSSFASVHTANKDKANKDEQVSMDDLKRTLREKGLVALLEALLQYSQDGFCTLLQQVTLHLEEQAGPNSCNHDKTVKPTVVIHCSHGKDRTGLAAMLMQACMGVSDKTIIADFAESSGRMTEEEMESVCKLHGVDRNAMNLLSSADPSIMKEILEWIRNEYGSVLGYLDAIGFDEEWRQRFRKTQEQ